LSGLVLDASTVLTWCFPDEKAHKAVEISERIAAGDNVTVPAFWRHEILNALLVGEKRKQTTPELTQAFVEELTRTLPVEVDPHATAATVFTITQALCRSHHLTAYDAAYLELAIRERRTLATLDDDLRQAALAENVAVL